MNSVNSHIIDDYKTESEKLHLIIDYIMHIYRISNGVITTNQVNKMCLHDSEYTYSKLVDLRQHGYDLQPFHNAIMNDDDYSLSNLIPLTEHCLLLKETTEQPVIDRTIIKNKLNSLLDNIKNEEVEELIDHQLSPVQRSILKKKEYEGQSIDEIAKELDMQQAAVRMQLSRARKTIRECYQKRHNHEAE